MNNNNSTNSASASTSSLEAAQNDAIFQREYQKYEASYNLATMISDRIDTFILFLGVLGNTAALITMLKSRSMSTPSFVYHKTLVAADLVFCWNFLLVKFIDQTQVDYGKFYTRFWLAYYVAVLNRLITSTCGYIVLYMSLAISLDRFVALWMIKTYASFNKMIISRIIVGLSLLLSSLVNSWSTCFEKTVYDFILNSTVIGQNGEVDEKLIVLYGTKPYNTAALGKWITVKNIYNMSIRVFYPILLTILTALVIWAFIVQQRKKRALCNVPTTRRVAREQSLYYLMVAVMILVYLQVLPREAKRVLELIYPISYTLNCMGDKQGVLSLEERLHCFRIFSYGHEFSKIMLNTLTAVDRSLVFYLYFALNHSFRKQVLKVFWLRQPQGPRRSSDVSELNVRRISNCLLNRSRTSSILPPTPTAHLLPIRTSGSRYEEFSSVVGL